MTDRDLAKSAMSAINSSIRNLVSAYSAGYRHGQPVPEAEDGDTQWTEVMVMRDVEVCELALVILRRMGSKGILGDKVIEVERAGAAIIMKMLGMGLVGLLVIRHIVYLLITQ
jgi:hypothetical protein